MKLKKALFVLILAPIALGQNQLPSINPHKNINDPVEIFVWANDLHDACFDDTVHAGDNLADVVRTQNNKGLCKGYIIALSEIFTKSEGVCWPVHVEVDDVIDGVKMQMSENQTLRDKQVPALAAVGLALQKTFPCAH